ncbi:hypothetical protein [Nocardiopsis synnemataformans]|uniref:hypothetical protein n=1 Tax=Nocardiopsis synnemataformans TaxID=61305 RepID=UPI003EB8B8DC
MSAPNIPVRLADRPTVGGLVVPWISARTDRGYHLGKVSNVRRERAIRGHLCQLDGELLDEKFVLLARPSDQVAEYVAEPALHPECAAYSMKACPMVAGRMEHYHATPMDLSQRTCADPERRCEVVSGPDAALRAGAPAEPWFAVWADRSQYQLAVGPDGALLGLVYPQEPLKVRPVPGTVYATALELLTTGGA